MTQKRALLRRRSPLLTGIGCVAATLAIGACGSSSSSSSSSAQSSSGQNSTAANASSSSSGRGGGIKMVMVPKSTSNPYYNFTTKGAQIAAQELGGSASEQGPTVSSSSAQIPYIDAAASQHVPVIAVAAADPNALVPSMKRAATLGSKVITFDADTAPAGRTLFLNQASLTAVGQVLAQEMVKEMGNSGQVAIISAQPTAANQNAWVAAAKAYWKSNDPGIQVVTEGYGNDNESTSFNLALSIMKSYPNLKGLFVPGCPDLPAAARAIESVGKQGKIQITGVCLPSLDKKYIDDGTMGNFVLWDPTYLGYVTYYAGYYLANHKITGKPGDTFKVGKFGNFKTYTVGKDGNVIVEQPLVFTKANVGKYPF